MLNMIISILGDSFDEFQLQQVYYDYREMTQVILEIEQIISLWKPENKEQYLHICDNYYQDDNFGWEGKVADVRECIQKSEDKINEKIDQRFDEFKSFEEKIKEIEILKTQTSSIDRKINSLVSLQGKMDSLEEKMKEIEILKTQTSCIDQKMESLERKLDSLIGMLSAKSQTF